MNSKTALTRALVMLGIVSFVFLARCGGSSAGFIYGQNTNMFTDATPPGSTDTITHGMNNFGRITDHGVETGIGRYDISLLQGTTTELALVLDPRPIHGRWS
jgi:hypothetical protein